MSSTSQPAQEQRPANFTANLTALHQMLREMFARTQSAISTTRERPAVLQGPVIVIRGEVGRRIGPTCRDFRAWRRM